MLLTDRVAVLTGVNSGIGRKTAEVFVQNGAKVLGVDIRTDCFDALAAAAESCGTAFLGFQGDVRNAEDAQNAFAQAVRQFGKIDIVVNIAGISCDRPISRISEAEFSRVMDINVKGVFNFCKYATPYFKSKKAA